MLLTCKEATLLTLCLVIKVNLSQFSIRPKAVTYLKNTLHYPLLKHWKFKSNKIKWQNFISNKNLISKIAKR